MEVCLTLSEAIYQQGLLNVVGKCEQAANSQVMFGPSPLGWQDVCHRGHHGQFSSCSAAAFPRRCIGECGSLMSQ